MVASPHLTSHPHSRRRGGLQDHVILTRPPSPPQHQPTWGSALKSRLGLWLCHWLTEEKLARFSFPVWEPQLFICKRKKRAKTWTGTISSSLEYQPFVTLPSSLSPSLSHSSCPSFWNHFVLAKSCQKLEMPLTGKQTNKQTNKTEKKNPPPQQTTKSSLKSASAELISQG